MAEKEENENLKYRSNKGRPYDSVFVVDEHWASHHHFDLRIRYLHYLVCWALPKARFPEKTNEKLLAKPTPNHALEWLTFQGKIPEGQYGAGTVKIWDKGDCRVYKWNDNVKVVNFKGKKLKGFFSIITTDEENAIILKMSPYTAGHYLKKDQQKLDEGYLNPDFITSNEMYFINEDIDYLNEFEL